MISALARITADFALPIGMAFIEGRYRRSLLSATRSPDAAQLKLLRRILKVNANTRFGEKCCFSEITSLQAYRRKVSVQTYETLRHHIDLQETTGFPELTAECPIYYARTSGTTGAPKDIPVTATVAGRAKIAQKLTALALYRQTDFFAGDILPLGSPSTEGLRGSGRAFGSASGQAYNSLSPLLKPKFQLPESVFGIEPYEERYYLSTLLGLMSGRLTGIATANPSTVLRLQDIVRQYGGDLISDLRGNVTQHVSALAPEFQNLVSARLAGSRGAQRSAAVLERLGADTRLADLWPDLSAVLSWTGGSCGIALGEVKRQLPEHTHMVELGFRASEMLGTVLVDVERNICLPALHDTYFEFVERDRWEAGQADFQTIGELLDGGQYYVFVTTMGGLYRYDMNDILKVTGRYNRTPVLEFVRKGRGVCSITGEKLCEDQVVAVARAATLAGERGMSFVALIGNTRASRYDVLIECSALVSPGLLDNAAIEFDTALRHINLEYDAKRASGRLQPIRAIRLAPGAAEYCWQDAVSRGQRESQYKPVCLSMESDWIPDLGSFQIGECAA